MAALDLGLLAALREVLGGELVDRVELAEAADALDLLGLDEALVGQRHDPVEDVAADLVGRPADRLGRLERRSRPRTRPAAHRSRRSPSLEQVVAPGDRAAQRLLALGQVARSRRQDAELVLEAAQDRVGRQELDPGRRQLDRERHPVEPGADRGDGRGVVVRDLEVGPDGERPRDEQPDGLVLGHEVGGDRPLVAREVQLLEVGHREQVDAGPAGPGPGTPARRRPGAGPGSSRSPGASARPGGGRRRPGRRRSPARSCRGRAAPCARPATPRAGRAATSPRSRQGRTSSRSATRTRAGSRTGSSATNHAPSSYSWATSAASWSDSRVLPVPPGPVSVSSRVVASSSPASFSSASRPTKLVSCVGRLLGRLSSDRIGGKSTWRPSIASWQMRSGRRSLSRCSPRLRSATPGGSDPDDPIRRGLREQDLAAVAGAADPGRPMDVGADVLAVGVERPVAGVEAHPDPDLGAVRPGLGGEVALGVDRGGHAPGHLGEDGEDAVALGLLLVPAGRPDRRPDDLAVAGEERRPGVDRQRLRELRRALDVGEQEGRRSRRAWRSSEPVPRRQ